MPLDQTLVIPLIEYRQHVDRMLGVHVEVTVKLPPAVFDRLLAETGHAGSDAVTIGGVRFTTER